MPHFSDFPIRRTVLLYVVFFTLLIIPTLTDAQETLNIIPGDAYIEVLPDGKGFSLYIKAKPGLGSVLITESSADPKKRLDSYALRAWDYNPINGNERRILNGQFLKPDPPLYFLVDSTPEANKLLGSAFHIYIPFQLTFGYSWPGSREGQVDVHRGTWLNIRTFERPYADYSGPWRDNPFVLSMKELPSPPPPVTIKEEMTVDNVEAAVELISEIIDETEGSIDVVLVVDTTVSMRDDLDFIRKTLVPMVQKRIDKFSSFRVGLLLFRDYKEAYLTRVAKPFTSDLNEIQKGLNAIIAEGGRDIPEAVNEGLFAGLTEFEWQSSNRIIILVGDAPPHDEPRGEITPEMVKEEATRLNVEIYPIKLPTK